MFWGRSTGRSELGFSALDASHRELFESEKFLSQTHTGFKVIAEKAKKMPIFFQSSKLQNLVRAEPTVGAKFCFCQKTRLIAAFYGQIRNFQKFT
jgi:hypothetical protein